MKKILWICICCFVSQWTTAQVTPKWAEKAKKAVFSIITYDKENKIKATGNGFYINANGTALSDYTLFEGADHATIITTDGKQQPVESISGANSMYDVVKFNTPMAKKQEVLTIASQPAKVGETIYLLPYSTQKATTCQTGKVISVDSIGNNSFYYTLELATNEKTVSCPIMNANGEVLGLIQKSVSEDKKESYAIGASFGAALSVTALSANDRSLYNIGIKKALPDTEEQALIYLFISSSTLERDAYLQLLNDFLEKYPNSYDGYVRRATLYMGENDIEQYPMAEDDLGKAIEVATNKSEAYFNVAKTIHAYLISLGEKEPYEAWSYGKALDIVRKAIKEDPQPLYIQLEGDILFADQKYSEAYQSYEKVNQSEMASPATFYSAAKTKQLIEGTDYNEIISLMDSAIVRFTKPYTSEAAPYFYERADMKAQVGKYKEAVMDYNNFYDALQGAVTAAFYFQREQSELQCRMYQQAINDINKAVEMEPENAMYWTEKGSVHIRFNQLDEAVAALNKAITLNYQDGVTYRLLGYCQVKQKKNKEACANFAKAKELGDTVVDKLIEKYCK